MKIKRLYENKTGVDILENFFDEEVKFTKVRSEFEKVKYDLYTLVDEYFKNFYKNRQDHPDYEYVTDIDVNYGDKWLEITYYIDMDEYDRIELEDEEYDDFINFLEDPEIYRNAKKYNL